MDNIVQIDAKFIEENTSFPELIEALKSGFSTNDILVPKRHHHDFPNPEVEAETTMLIMPAWNPGKDAGLKMVTINPENGQFNLPSIQGTYIYFNAKTGVVKAMLNAKNLTAKRTAAASALASSFLSNKNARSLLMIGTGALSINLIKAHTSIRPIDSVFIWGRNFEKALAICKKLSNEKFSIEPIKTIEEQLNTVDIVSCATLSKTPLVLGKYVKKGQHIDLVGAYKKDMREADDDVIQKSSLFIDTYDGLNESGDLAIPIARGIISQNDIKADLFKLCSGETSGRSSPDDITVFKSVGHALEDLIAAKYYYTKFKYE